MDFETVTAPGARQRDRLDRAEHRYAPGTGEGPKRGTAGVVA